MLGNYVFFFFFPFFFFFFLKKSTVSFKRVWLFSYFYTQQTRARIVSRNYTLRVFPPQICEHEQFIDEYIQNAGRSLPSDPAPYLETRSGVKRLMASSLIHARRAFFHGLRLTPSMKYLTSRAQIVTGFFLPFVWLTSYFPDQGIRFWHHHHHIVTDDDKDRRWRQPGAQINHYSTYWTETGEDLSRTWGVQPVLPSSSLSLNALR